MDEIIYKVFALLDNHKCIESVESTAFHTEEKLLQQGYIQIDEGAKGDIYGHAQPNYLLKKYGKTTYDEKDRCNFKYVSNKVVELSDEEKEVLYPPVVQQPSEQELVNSQLMLEIAKLKAGVQREL